MRLFALFILSFSISVTVLMTAPALAQDHGEGFQDMQSACSVSDNSSGAALQEMATRSECRMICRDFVAENSVSAADLSCLFMGVDESAEYMAGYDLRKEEPTLETSDVPNLNANQDHNTPDGFDNSVATTRTGGSSQVKGYGFEEKLDYLDNLLKMADGVTIPPEKAKKLRKELNRLQSTNSQNNPWGHNIQILSLESQIARAAGGGVEETHKLMGVLIRTKELEGNSPQSAFIQTAKAKHSYLKTLHSTLSSGGLDPAEKSHLLQELDSLGSYISK